MAQFLKDEIRREIINSATKEFFDKGYKNSSMRRIAKSANITVGNLYRYFKNKEELYSNIVSEAYIELENVLSKISNKRLSLTKVSFDSFFDKIDIDEESNNILNNFVNYFGTYIKNYRDKFIIMTYNDCPNIQKTNLHLEGAFESIFKGYCKKCLPNFSSVANEYFYEILARAFIEGFIKLVYEYDENFKKNLELYTTFFFKVRLKI